MFAHSLHPVPRLDPPSHPVLRFCSQRGSRVLTLMAAVIALSAVDLYFTLMYASTIGMPELNPLARALLRHGTVLDLVLFKAGTLAICTGILFRLRDRRSAEIGAWIAFAALAWLTFQWLAYAQLHESIAGLNNATEYDLASAFEPHWVQFGSSTAID